MKPDVQAGAAGIAPGADLTTSDTANQLPFFRQPVPAGFPSPALDYMEERIDLNKTFIPHPLATFLVECTGDSMINAFIPPGAILLVDRARNAQNGDIVLAVVNGEFTVKFLKRNEHRCWLVPANSKYRELEITPEMDFQVWGVVTQVITGTEKLRKCMR